MSIELASATTNRIAWSKDRGATVSMLKDERSAFDHLFDSHVRFQVIESSSADPLRLSTATSSEPPLAASTADSVAARRCRDHLISDLGRTPMADTIVAQDRFIESTGATARLYAATNSLTSSTASESTCSSKISKFVSRISPVPTVTNSVFLGDDGVHVVMRDSSHDSDSCHRLASRLRKALQRLGFGLIKLTINGNTAS